jgi:hypothetical protein
MHRAEVLHLAYRGEAALQNASGCDDAPLRNCRLLYANGAHNVLSTLTTLDDCPPWIQRLSQHHLQVGTRARHGCRGFWSALRARVPRFLALTVVQYHACEAAVSNAPAGGEPFGLLSEMR